MSKRWVVTAGLILALAETLGVPAVTGQEAGIPVESKAPIVSVHDLDGKPVDLGQWIGKRPVFLEFWASWCTSCAALLPRVKAAARRYGSQIEFVGINVAINQTPARARKYVETEHPPYRALYDDQGASTRAYHVPGTSYVVIIDARGTVVYTGFGGSQDFEAALRKATAG
jgi:thiol-disulfide isomerase/thioredoxin